MTIHLWSKEKTEKHERWKNQVMNNKVILNYVKRIHSSQPSGTGHILQKEQPWKNYKVTSVNISQEDTTGDKAGVESSKWLILKQIWYWYEITPVPRACFRQIQRTQVLWKTQNCFLLTCNTLPFPLLQRGLGNLTQVNLKVAVYATYMHFVLFSK